MIAKILTHLGLSARAPPRSPARALDRDTKYSTAFRSLLERDCLPENLNAYAERFVLSIQEEALRDDESSIIHLVLPPSYKVSYRAAQRQKH